MSVELIVNLLALVLATVVAPVPINSISSFASSEAVRRSFVGATSSAAGTAGLVDAPAIAERTKFLKGDGTWAVPAGGGGGGDVTEADVIALAIALG